MNKLLGGLAHPIFRAVFLVLLTFVLALHLIIYARPIQVTYDLPTILLASASLALLILSLVVAGLAVFEARNINRRIRAAVDEGLQRLENEYRAAINTTIGLFYGRVCREMVRGRPEVQREDFRRAAIAHTAKALELYPEDSEHLEPLTGELQERLTRPRGSGAPGVVSCELRDELTLATE